MTIHHGLLLERLNDQEILGDPHRPEGLRRNGTVYGVAPSRNE